MCLRPEPHHGCGRGLERAGPVSRCLDAEARGGRDRARPVSTAVPARRLDRRRAYPPMLVSPTTTPPTSSRSWLGGSTSGGAVTRSTRSDGARSASATPTCTGGYVLDASAARGGIGGSRFTSTTSRPGASASARPRGDLARLLRAVWLASGGLGPLRARAPGFTRRPTRATCSASSPTSATRASSTASSGAAAGRTCSAQGGLDRRAPGTTTGSSSGAAVCSSRPS